MTQRHTTNSSKTRHRWGINSKVYWYAGMILDIVHMPIVLVIVLLGAVWFPGPLYISIIVTIVILQVALLACPVMALTGWLKQRHEPGYENHWSLTYWLYQRYGASVAIPVFVGFLGAAIVVRRLL